MLDEIKLYGEMEGDEALDESFCEDSFAQLEAVMSKVCNMKINVKIVFFFAYALQYALLHLHHLL